MGVDCPECSRSSLDIHHFVNRRPKSGLLSIKAVRAQTSEPACAQRALLPNQARASACLQDSLLPQIVQYWSQVTNRLQIAHTHQEPTCEYKVQVNRGNHKQFRTCDKCSVVKWDCPCQGCKAQCLCRKGISPLLQDNIMTSNQAFKTGGRLSWTNIMIKFEK